MQNVVIQNNSAKAQISTLGAELRRLVVNEQDILWPGDKAIWDGISPVLFPMCGACADDRYTLNGDEYIMPKHGFAKNMEFEVEQVYGERAVLLLKDSEETFKYFPWHFEFRVIYELKENGITVTYDVKNLSDSTMYFSVGAHEGYSCPKGVGKYTIDFSEKETLGAYEVVGSLLSDNRTPIIENSNVLQLKDEHFEIDALVFKELKSRSLTLRGPGIQTITLDFEGFDYFLIWSIPKAPYVCLEPWTGIPPTLGADKAIETKEGITSVAPNESFKVSHSITIG